MGWPQSLTWQLSGSPRWSSPAGSSLETCFPKVRWTALSYRGCCCWEAQQETGKGSVCWCLLCSCLGLLLTSPLSVVTSFGEEVSGKSKLRQSECFFPADVKAVNTCTACEGKSAWNILESALWRRISFPALWGCRMKAECGYLCYSWAGLSWAAQHSHRLWK